MIQSFADAETALIWSGRRSRRLPADIQLVALRKLRLLNQARILSDLRAWQSTGGVEGRPGGSIFDPRHRPAAHLLQLAEVRPMSKLPIAADPDWLPNPTPGEILLEEFLQPLNLSQTSLARALRVPPRRINEIVLGKRAVTADTDLRLTRYFGLTPGFFLGLQADHDLMERRRELGADLELIAPRAA